MRSKKPTTDLKVISRINRIIEEKGIKNSDLSKIIGSRNQTIHGFRQRKDCYVNRLHLFSEILNYNFFQEMADDLNIPYPTPKSNGEYEKNIISLKEEINNLRDQLKMKNLEIEVFQRIINNLGISK